MKFTAALPPEPDPTKQELSARTIGFEARIRTLLDRRVRGSRRLHPRRDERQELLRRYDLPADYFERKNR